jgi:hypothetical protein
MVALRRSALLVAALATVAGAAAAAPKASGLDARLVAVGREVAAVRGGERGKPPTVEPVEPGALGARAAAELVVSPAETLALRRLGLIGPTDDPTALLATALADPGPARYLTGTRTLLVESAAAADPAPIELALARELARRAAGLRLGGGKLAAGDLDAAAARIGIVDGDALATMVEVALARDHAAAPWSDPRVVAALTADLEATPLGHASPWVRSRLLAPARAGLGLVAALRRRAPWSAVDAALRRPPRSTAQLLHPARYVVDERPVVVAIASPPSLRGLARRHEAVWGELGFAAWLEASGVDREVAAVAAAGWRGDDAVVFAADGEDRPADATVVWRLTWETDADAIEAAQAATRAVDQLVGPGGEATERAADRTRWRAADGKLATVERRGESLLIVLGSLTAAVFEEGWSAGGRTGGRKPRP